MATLERRVQVLFDPTQYEALEAEAADLRMSVGALVREAVNDRLRVRHAARSEALQRLLASADTDSSLGAIDWEQEKGSFERESLRDLP